MQKAIENFIDIQSKLGMLFDDIKVEIDKVEEIALEKAKREQRYQWRKPNKHIKF